MLKVPYKRLRPNSKGGLSHKHNKCGYQHRSKLHIANVGRRALQGIPVLSIFALVGIVSIGIISANNLTNLFFPAEEAYAIDEVVGDSSASITISGSASNETISAGRGSTVYRTHTISIAGNNVKNYILSIYGDSKLAYVENSTTGQLSTTEYLSSANGATGSNLPTNTWGYAYSDNSSTSIADLTYTAPTPTAKELTKGTIASSANGVLSITNNKLVFAAKFDEDKPSGNYKANVNLALTIAPRVLTTYSITYNGNGNTSGTVPTKQEASLYDTSSHSFIASTQGTLAKTGYTFLGWSESSTATTPTYTAGATIPLTAANPSKVLYAVWKHMDFNSISTMQEMTADICEAASIGEATSLIDTRDNNTYTIARLKDGNCWMTQNLRLQGYRILNSTDSDVSSFALSAPVPSLSSSNFASSNTSRNESYAKGNTVYYNWYTATAGTGSASMSSGNATSSICPKGWKLPTGGSGGQFNALLADVSYASIIASPYHYQIVGAVLDGRVVHESYGYYWSRTAASASNAYYLFITGSAVTPTASLAKYVGYPIRCVAAYSS